MADRTGIQWTDATWPVVNGCTRISAGCGTGTSGGCYAERLVATRLRSHPKYAGLAEMHNGKPRWTGEVRLWEPDLELPLRWRKPRRIFVANMGDLFHERVPDEWIDRVFAVMALRPRHTFQILSKRPERMRAYVSRLYAAPRSRLGGAAYSIISKRTQSIIGAGISAIAAEETPYPLPNVHLYVSVEDQRTADERIGILLRTPAAVRGVSYEPALDPVDFFSWLSPCGCYCDHGEDGYGHRPVRSRLGHIIVGGESGPRARPCDVRWIRNVVEQCRAAGVACFTKQLGSNVIDRNDRIDYCEDDPETWPEATESGESERYQGAPVRVLLRDSHGGDMDEWPRDLRVREFPEAGCST